MMRRKAVLWLVALVLAAGCTSIRDGRGPTDICEVHNTIMHEEVVPAPRDNDPLPAEYVEAGLRLFPHAWPKYHPSHGDKVVVYICDECVRAQEEWMRLHPGVVK
jgi:hypothetical protein